MEPLLVYPDPPPAWLASTFESAGYEFVGTAAAGAGAAAAGAGTAAGPGVAEPDEGWAGAVVVAGAGELASVLGVCRDLAGREEPVRPLLLAVAPEDAGGLDFREDLFDDFFVVGASSAELEARLARLFRRGRSDKEHELIVYGPLALNPDTYQAALAGRPLDLTYMEYELLRYLASHPGKVFTREILLSRVWGYEYYGGARTVDVHIRRLRAKFGEEHAQLIETVRSVGYRFGSVRWLPASAEATRVAPRAPARGGYGAYGGSGGYE